MSRLKELYDSKLKTELKNNLNCKNLFEVPRLKKIVLNMGVGETVTDSKKINAALDDLMMIAGQKPAITKAKQSIATFKLRKGMNIGCKVTLRKERMYEFLDRLVNIAIPRIRDFRGLSDKSFDGRGNYNMGINEQIVFPEIDFEKVTKMRGMDIAITTNAKNDDDAKKLLAMFNFPFKG